MDTIMNYLNTMFATVAQTEQMQKIKNDLAANMEDKYHELKAEGKSENEAVGTVISEFGNIEELLKDIGISSSQTDITATAVAPEKRLVTREETDAYFLARAKQNRMTAFGVVLILLGVSAMILLFGILDNSNSAFGLFTESTRRVIPPIMMLLTVAAAVPLFIIGGMQFERYEYMEKGIALPETLRRELTKKMEQDRTVNVIAVTTGVALCILGVIVLLILVALSEQNVILREVGVASLILLVAVACYLFICPGGMKEGYEKILGVGEYTPEKEKENRVVGVVASVVWPVTVAVFLVWGLAFNGWRICWIVFPVVGMCFGGFAAAYGAMTERK